MSTDAIDKTLAEAQRLLDCDGPHMRAWMREDRDGFLAAVHRVAALALLTGKPAPEPAKTYDASEGGTQSRQPVTRALRKG